MARAYKVRLGDGSEIGPLDEGMLRSWYQQGLIEEGSPVQPLGARQWTTLSRLVDVRAWGLPPKLRKKRKSADTQAQVAAAAHSTPQPWRTRLAAIFLLLGAVGAGIWSLFPGTSLPDLDGTPWRELALVQFLFGLCLIRWALARRFVRVAILMMSFALFPVAGLLVAQGERGKVYLVLFAAWVLASGLFALLSPSPLAPMQAALCVAGVVLGFVGVGYLGYVPPGVGHRQIEAKSSGQRRFADASLGLVAQLPEGWSLLETPLAEPTPLGQAQAASIVSAPAGASAPAAPPRTILRVAQPRLGAFGYLQVERSVSGITSAEQYLDRFVTQRRQGIPSLKELARTDALVGRLPARLATESWTSDEGAFREQAVAWRDGWNCFALVVWAPEARLARFDPEWSALLHTIAPDGRETERLRQATASLSDDLPHLSPRGVELLLSPRCETSLGVPEACRRGWQAALRGRRSLDELEQRELIRLDSLMGAALPPRDQQRFTSYLERVRANGPTSRDEDAEMSQLTRTAVLALPESSRVRLQALNEKAIAAQ
jgi:hypothetical protein